MHDVQLEDRLRKALRAEADDLPFTLTADVVARRLAATQAAARRARFGLLASAAAVVVVAGGAFLWLNRAIPPVAATPSPSPATSSRPNGVLPYPDVQSAGELVISFDGRPAAMVDVFLTCEWTSTERVGYFYVNNPVQMLGEPVSVSLIPDSEFYLLTIDRHTHAGYRGGPLSGDAVVDGKADLSDGVITFTNLAPDPETAAAGPMPTPSDGWTLPLGGDLANASISGTAAWSCAPPPATVPTPAPPASDEPSATHPPFPTVAVHSADGATQPGSPGCGASWQLGTESGGDDCGPSFQALGDEHVLRVKAGSKLTFTTTDGWTFASWSIGWAPQSDAEKLRGAQPDTYEQQEVVATASGTTITRDAPPVGDWSVVFGWTVGRGTDYFAQPDYFRIVVEP